MRFNFKYSYSDDLLFKKIIFLISLISQISLAQAAIDKKASVTVKVAELREYADELSYPGRVLSQLNAVKNSTSEGQITKILKNLGHKVHKGDAILVLQNTDPVYRFAPVYIRSEVSGYLTTLDVTLMSRVERGQKLFTITNPSDLIIEIEVPASDLPHLKIGATAQFRPNVNQENFEHVYIAALSPLVDIKTGTATAQLKAKTQSAMLILGQLGQVRIQANQRKTFILPDSSIIYRSNKSFIRIIENNRAMKKEVVLGKRISESFEILSGIHVGDKVISSTSRFISDGEEVIIQDAIENL